MYDLMRQGRYDLMPALLSSREAADAVGARFGNRWRVNRDSLLRYSGLIGPGKEARR